MKRMLLIAMVLLLAVFGVSQAEVGMANPWTDTTAQGLMDALGLQLGLPGGATDVAWQMLEAEQMGQVRFRWEGEGYTARIAPTDVFEDISGLHYQWEYEDACQIDRCQGLVRRTHDGDNTVDLCLWHDDLTGLMYSVSVEDTDLDGFDIQAAAQILYIPMQTE